MAQHQTGRPVHIGTEVQQCCINYLNKKKLKKQNIIYKIRLRARLVQFNARSLFKKIDQCRVLFEGENIDIITVLETWLSQIIPVSSINIKGYSTLRQDRNFSCMKKKRGGGLITLIHEKHSNLIQELPNLSISNKHFEALWTKLNMPNCLDIVISNIYRPPNSELLKCIEYLEDCLASINTNKTDVFFLGDLNVDFNNKTD